MKKPVGRLIGYARVSTEEQATDAQAIELKAAGCDEIVTEHGSGASRARPALGKLLDGIQSRRRVACRAPGSPGALCEPSA